VTANTTSYFCYVTGSRINRIAQEQATAMAARDVLDHAVAAHLAHALRRQVPDTLLRISLMETTTSPKPSINGSPPVGIAKIF
jgi:hypothetical protein